MSTFSNGILDRYRKALTNKQIATLRGLYGGIRQTYADERREAYLEGRRALGQIGASASALGLGQGYYDRKEMSAERELNKYGDTLNRAADSHLNALAKQQVAANHSGRGRGGRGGSRYTMPTYQQRQEQERQKAATQDFVNALTSDKATFKPSQVAGEPRYNRYLLDLMNDLDRQAGGTAQAPRLYEPPKPSQMPNVQNPNNEFLTGNKATANPAQVPEQPNTYLDQYFQTELDKYNAEGGDKQSVELYKEIKTGKKTVGDVAGMLKGASEGHEAAVNHMNEIGNAYQQMVEIKSEFDRLSAMAGDATLSPDQRRAAAGQARRLAEEYNKAKQQYDALTAEYGPIDDIYNQYVQYDNEIKAGTNALKMLGYDDFAAAYLAQNGSLPENLPENYNEWARTHSKTYDEKSFDYQWVEEGNIHPAAFADHSSAIHELAENKTANAKKFWEVVQADPEEMTSDEKIEWLNANGYEWLVTDDVRNSIMTGGIDDGIAREIERYIAIEKEYEAEKRFYFMAETIANDPNAQEYIDKGEQKSQLYDWLTLFRARDKHNAAKRFNPNAPINADEEVEAQKRLGIKNLGRGLSVSLVESFLDSGLSDETQKKLEECFGIKPTKDLLNAELFAYMTDEEAQAINYLLGMGDQDALEEYVYRVQARINQQLANKQADEISGMAPEGLKFIPEAVGLTASGALGFFENIDRLAATGKLPPSVNELLTGEVMRNQVERGWGEDWAEIYSGAFQSMGNMLPSIALGAVLGPVGTELMSAAEGSSGATAALVKGAGWIVKHAGTISMGLGAGSHSKMEGLREGKPLTQATIYGVINGMSETLLQETMGGVANLGTGGMFKKLLKGNVDKIGKTWVRMLANLGLETMGEMTEEYSQEILEPIFRNIAYGEHNGVKLYTREAKNAALSALVSTVLMNGLGSVKSIRYEDLVSDVMRQAKINAEDAARFIEIKNQLIAGIENGEGFTLNEEDTKFYNEVCDRIIAGELNNLIEQYKPAIKYSENKENDGTQLYSWFKAQAEATEYEDGMEIPAAERAKNREAYMELAEEYLEGKVSTYSDGPVQVVTINGETLDRSKMSLQEKILYSLTQKMATAFPNVKFVVHDTLPTANGLITGDGTVHIALDSVQKYDAAASYVLAHELTHALKKGDNAAWAEMRSKIEDYFKSTEAGRVAIARAEATALRDAQRAAGRSESAREQANMTDEEKAALKDKLTTSDIYQDEYASVLAEQFFGDPVILNDFLDSIIKDKEMDRTEKKGFIQKVKDLLEKAISIFRKQGRKVPKDMQECLDVVKDKLSKLNEGEALDVRIAKRREADMKAREEARKERAKTPKKAQIDLGETDNVEAAPTPMRQERGAETTIAQGNEGTLRYGPGNKQTIKFHYALVNVNDLVASHNINGDENEAYPSELQPRDRSRVASQTQVREIANDIIPEKLGQSGNVQDGAPIIGRDMIVESGNGRTIALQYAAQQGKLNGYTAWLKEHAPEFGLNADDVQNGTVLVRVRDSVVDRAAFAKEANKSTTAVLNATERAQSDAKALAKVLNKYVFNENGDLNTAANSDFLSAFIRAAAGTNEANSLVTKNGTLSAEGMTRIQNALFELAYHDQTLTEQFSEGDESPLRNVIRAMMNVAPVAAQISEGIKAGDFYAVDFAEDIVEAEKFLKDLKQNPKYENETRKAAEHYELYPGTMLGAVPDYLKKLEIAMDENIRSGRNLSYLLNRVLEGVKNMGDPNQVDMFGGMYDLSTEEAVNEQKGRIVDRAIKATEEWKAQRAEEAKRYSSRDAAYMPLAEKYRDGTATEEEKAELEKRVEEAARKAGYTVQAYHGTSRGGFNIFDYGKRRFGLFGEGFYFTEDKSVADTYQKKGKGSSPQTYSVFLNVGNELDMDAKADVDAWIKSVAENADLDIGAFLPADIANLTNTDCFKALTEAMEYEGVFRHEAGDIAEGVIISMGYDGLTHKGGIRRGDKEHTVHVVFDADRIKSADPVTYDSNGDIIPLSERFRTDRTGDEAWKNEDIRYSSRATDTPAFKEWFGESKVVDEDGNPKVVYHGTDADFTTFDETKGRSTMDIQGMFFSPWEIDAAGYGKNVGAYYLSIENPAPEGIAYKALNKFKGQNEAGRKARQYLESLGYDGVNNSDEEFIAFYPWQIKSATDNIGTFDRFNNDTRYSSRADSDIALWNPPDVDTRGIYKAVKNGSGKVDGRFDVTVDTGNNGFNVTIKDTQTGETYKDGATVEAGENAEAFAERYTAAIIRNIKSGRPESTSRSTAGIYIEKGENPVRDVNIPVFDVNGDKVRRFMRTVEESGAIPDDMVDDIKKDIMAGGESYKPISNKSALAYADGLMQHQLTAQNEWNKVKDSYKIPKPGDIALGERLLKAAAQAGNTQDALKFAAELSDMLTRAGQAIQAARLLKQMGSAAEVYYITRAVSRINADLAKTAQAYNVELNEDLVQKLVEAQTDKDRDKAKEEILKDIARQIKPTLSEKLNSWRYLAMLFNVRTHVRNFIGNAAMMPAANIRYLLSSAMEATTVHRENRTKTLNVGKEYKTFAEDDWKSTASKAVKSRGNKYQDLKSEIDEYRKIFKGPLEVLRKFNGRALETEDMLYKQAYYRKALAGYLAARKVDIKALKAALAAEKSGKAIIKGSQEERLIEQYVRAQAYAINEANVFTYNDANRLASVISEASRTLRNGGGIGKAGHLLIEGILPFKNTPANILGRAIDFSPLGYIRTASSAISKAIKHEYSSTEFIDNLSRNMVGTMVMAIGFALGKAGLLTGALGYDDDDKDKKRTGHQSYALEVGNTSITLDWLAPMSIPLFAGVELYNVLQEAKVSDENMWRALKAAVTGSLEPLINLSMLEGVQGAFETVKYSETPLIDLAATLGTNYLTQYIPTLSGQFARSIDPYQRRKYTGKANFLTPIIDSFVQNVLKKIPGANRLLQPYVNEWGEKESNFDKRGLAALTDGRFWLNALENFISPSYINTIKETAPDGEIARLLDSLGGEALKAIPSAANKSITYDGTKYNLTADEYTAYAELRGQTSYALVQSMIGTDAYNRLTDAEKVEAMVNAYKYADAVAKSAYLETKLGDKAPKLADVLKWADKANGFAEIAQDKDTALGTFIGIKTYLDGMDEDGGNVYGNISDYTVTKADGTTTVKWNDMKWDYLQSLGMSPKETLYLASALNVKESAFGKMESAASIEISDNDYAAAFAKYQELTKEAYQKKEQLSDEEYEEWKDANSKAFEQYIDSTKLNGEQKFWLMSSMTGEKYYDKAKSISDGYGIKMDALWNIRQKVNAGAKAADLRQYVNGLVQLNGKQKFAMLEYASPSTNWYEQAEEAVSKCSVSYELVWRLKMYAEGESGTGKKARIKAFAEEKLGVHGDKLARLLEILKLD